MKHISKILILGTALVSAAPFALADPLTGNMTFNGGNAPYDSAGNFYFTAQPITISGFPAASGIANGLTSTYGGGATFSSVFTSPSKELNYNNTAPYVGDTIYTVTDGSHSLSFVFLTENTLTTGTGGFTLTGTGYYTGDGYSNTPYTFDLTDNAGSFSINDYQTPIAPTPEPSSLILLGTGLVGAAGAMFRRRRIADVTV